MTTSPLYRLPVPASLHGSGDAAAGQSPTDELTDEERIALQVAAAAGERAAAWVRELARRQPVEAHGTVLDLVAGAVERATGREIVPYSDGLLVEELRERLDGYVLVGATAPASVPKLAPGERIALAAVVSLAAAMPSTVLTWFERELPLLAQVMDEAVAAGRS
ncbi:hypothetical protein [Streptomyces sp. CBMA156]|uniref:hypothetical protein n=1 Tax=Streptomyces sp. CBMA156 TaxID=1930280 RepID=UPI00166200D5|nr:hypothetical protein [Streptomyces sp. CBMA156]MBD0675481.1 hypothetical protein [Streptomyces sp. CBMA156]